MQYLSSSITAWEPLPFGFFPCIPRIYIKITILPTYLANSGKLMGEMGQDEGIGRIGKMGRGEGSEGDRQKSRIGPRKGVGSVAFTKPSSQTQFLKRFHVGLCHRINRFIQVSISLPRGRLWDCLFQQEAVQAILAQLLQEWGQNMIGL